MQRGKKEVGMRFLPWAVVIVLWIYCWVEVAQSDPAEVRLFRRGLWALVVAVPLFGACAWLVYGRPNGTRVARRPAAPPPKRTTAPDDDPDFLRSLRNRRPDDDGSARQ
jgi:Phospholipase_D-nuclease N-terminal